MHASSLVQENFYNPTLAQCYDYLSHMKLPLDEVAMIEEATRGQLENKLWFAIRNGRLTSFKFGEILYGRQSTHPRRLVQDMGYGALMKSTTTDTVVEVERMRMKPKDATLKIDMLLGKQ